MFSFMQSSRFKKTYNVTKSAAKTKHKSLGKK